MDIRKVDELVSLAAASNAMEDYDRLFAALEGAELFFNVSTEQAGAKSAPVSTPLVTAGPGLSAVLFFTSRDNVNLKKPYGGIVWEKALEMLVKMPQADGLIIQSRSKDWVGLDKEKARLLLSAHSSQP
ncbi:SseB family protein [Dyella choica]|uniref:Uncharacterized protein n=1 Tax=Dyella choica TaxID=1927959 RepID=A0A432M2P2_9GAMM|nr:SseB family protein [Dyella choica]RUL72505.1 hypothetical protein EKH80_17660 [Dyella choica]